MVCDDSEVFVVEVEVAEQPAVCKDLEELGDWLSVFVEAGEAGLGAYPLWSVVCELSEAGERPVVCEDCVLHSVLVDELRDSPLVVVRVCWRLVDMAKLCSELTLVMVLL
jgi:hypothetical protein